MALHLCKICLPSEDEQYRRGLEKKGKRSGDVARRVGGDPEEVRSATASAKEVRRAYHSAASKMKMDSSPRTKLRSG